MLRRTVIVWIVIGSLPGLPAATLRAADEKPDELLQMIVKVIGDKDNDFRAAGLDQVRTGAKGQVPTKLFAAQLPKLGGSPQVALLSALAARDDAAARPAVLELLASSVGDDVRVAAVAALG